MTGTAPRRFVVAQRVFTQPRKIGPKTLDIIMRTDYNMVSGCERHIRGTDRERRDDNGDTKHGTGRARDGGNECG